MASLIIHMAVASEINKKINKNYKELLLGSISPDMPKFFGIEKEIAHFIEVKNSDIPNLKLFIDKYSNYLNDDFVLGYYIHLYTDYLWYREFSKETYNLNNNTIKLHDGSIIPYDYDVYLDYTYIDYTNMDYDVADYYHINIYDFINNIPKINNKIEEIDVNKMNEFLMKYKEIYENHIVKKTMIFDFEQVKEFVNYATNIILKSLKKED